MTKAHLRKEFLAKRMFLNETEQQNRIEHMTTWFEKIQLQKVDFALSYMALSITNETAPASVENLIIHQYPNCNLCYPKIDLIDNSMEAIEFARGNNMRKNKWGIAEPVSGNSISPQQIDVVLVPLLCFDKRGYRVGYGKGFYDRYIARCRPDVITVGLSFFEPVNGIDDIDEYDMPMKYCVTPEKLYQF